jgi:serine/threonine-protein kinase
MGPTPPPEALLYLGQTLGSRFTVDEYIARGSFCLIFQGRDLADNDRLVALKILGPSVHPDSVTEFETEGRLLEDLAGCTHVVDLLTTDTDSILVRTVPVPSAASVLVPLPVRFMVLELADACLTELVVHRKSLSCVERLRLFRNVVLGTHQMHLHGVVHRDIKSENVLVFHESGTKVVAKVADLGRSRRLRDAPRFPATAYATGRGDLRFAPPEALWLQLSDDPNAMRRADLYLLGSLLFELFVGQPLTSLAIGNPLALVNANATLSAEELSRQYRSRLSEIRSNLAIPISFFATELPAVIRNETISLILQLSDPDPVRRERRFRSESPAQWGSDWLLRRVDILIARIGAAEAQAARLQKRKRDRSA